MSTKATTYESLDNKIAASTLTEDLVKGLEVVDGHAIKEKKDYEKPDELYDMLIARIRQYLSLIHIQMCIRDSIDSAQVKGFWLTDGDTEGDSSNASKSVNANLNCHDTITSQNKIMATRAVPNLSYCNQSAPSVTQSERNIYRNGGN